MAQGQGPRHKGGRMSQCHILPPHREHSFRGAEGCTKDISHDGPHTAVLKDGTTIEWDPKAEQIIGNERIASFFAREPRKGFEIPRV